MKSLARQIAVLAALLILVCAVNRLAHHNAYTAYVPVDARAAGEAAVRADPDDPGRLEVGKTRLLKDHLRVEIVPRQRGEAVFRVYEGGERVAQRELRVLPMMTVYDSSTGGFTGDTVTLVAATAFFLLVAVLMIRYYLGIRGPAFYAYTTVYAAGFSLFALLTGTTLLYVTVRRLLEPAGFSMLSAYAVIRHAGATFMLATSPLVAAFAVAMAVSNVALMRHEGPKLKNALGILAGLLLIAGEALELLLDRGGVKRPGVSEDAWQVALSVYPTVFVYFECMLLGAILCGLKAADQTPELDKDYIVILGCLFRRDGTLTPLLRGRVDRAIAFWRQQRAAGRTAVFIPSGGQGPDEPMAEAEAMARYLRDQGVPGDGIIPEDRSRNTYQNMAFSKAIIDREKPGARVVFVTTNYHVFRSGVWSNLAGLHAEGLGSGTKWWYWPNAFMRECLGLLKNRWRQEILLLAVLVAFFGLLTALL